MNDLKPCPFCGGNPELEEADIKGFWRIRCENADCVAGASWCNSYDREKLAGAWNARHESTCHMSLVPTWEEPSTYHCDRCHADNAGVWNDNGNTFKPSYCPYCGAKEV